MIFKRRSSPKSDDRLGPRGEALWDELRGRIEGEREFVWCFISTASPRASDLFLRRLRKLSKQRGYKISLRETALPSRLSKLTRGLIEGRWVARYDYIWLQAADSVRNQQDSEWQRAWAEALRFLSARRRELEARFKGIVVSGPPEMEGWLPDAVPSIWPLQPLTIELRPSWLRSDAPGNGLQEAADGAPPDRQAAPEAETSSHDPARPASADQGEEQPQGGSDPAREEPVAAESHRDQEGKAVDQGDAQETTDARAEEDGSREGNDPRDETPVPQPGQWLREAVQAFREGDLRRTVELTRQITKSGGSSQRCAEAYALRARAEKQAGRLADAARHISLALSALESDDRGDLLRWYDLAGRIALRRQRLEEAFDYYQQALELARRRLQAEPGAATRRSLSVILNRLSEVQMRRGQVHEARVLGREALQLRKQLVEDVEEPSPALLRDLSYSYYLLAMLEESDGRLELALDYIRESLILDRRISEDAPGPDSRRNLAATLKLTAHLKRRLGHENESRRLLLQAESLRARSETSS